MTEKNKEEKPIVDVGSLIVISAHDAERVEKFKKANKDIREARALVRQEKKEVEAAKKLAKQGTTAGPDWTAHLEQLNAEGKYGNSDYLLDLFEDADLKYLKNIKKDCENKGFPETPLFTEYLFLTTINHRLHIAYVYATKNQSENGHADKILETISKNQERISDLEATLAKLALEKREGEDIPALHQKVLGAAEKFIREHAGEFSFLCQSCRTVVQADGLPHWALVKGEYEDAKYYFIFNSQLWQLVLEKKIPVAYMAFALRTSIVGIKFTVEARKERWPDWIDVLREEKILKELMDAYKLDGIEEQKKHIENLGGGV